MKRKHTTAETAEIEGIDAADVATDDGGQSPVLPIRRSLRARASDTSVAPTVIDVSEEEGEEESDSALLPVGLAGSMASRDATSIVHSTAGSAAVNPLEATLGYSEEELRDPFGYTEEELRYPLNGCSDADEAEVEDNEAGQKNSLHKVRNASFCISAATMLSKSDVRNQHASYSSSLTSAGIIRRSQGPRVSLQYWNTHSFAGTLLCQQAGLSPLIWGASASFAAAMRGTGRVLAEHSMIASMPSHLQAETIHLLGQARAAGIQFHSAVGSATATAGEAKRLINSRLMMKGRDFYVGITEDPARRFSEHQQNGYVQMDLFVFPSSAESGDCEIAILRSARELPNCQNRSAGGEVRSCREPHFCYIAWRP